MSVAHFPNSVNGRTNTVPECGPPVPVEPESPHACRGAICCHEVCITERCRKRQEAVARLTTHAGAVQLAGILNAADRLAADLRSFMGTHGPKHCCRLCKFLRVEVEECGGGNDQWWEDLLVLRANLESNTSILMHTTPGAITFHLLRDLYGDEG